MEPPSLRDWLAQTDLGAMHVRSPQLRDLDKAIEAYGNNRNPADRAKYLSRIQQALSVWGKTCPGADARNSSRNKGGAVTRLMSAFYQQKQFTEADKEAFLWQEEQRRKRMEDIFRGKSVLWKAGDPIRDAVQAIKNLKSGAPAAKKPEIKGISPKGAGPFQPDRDAILKVQRDMASQNKWAQRTSSGLVSGTQAALSAGAEAVAFQQMISSLFNGSNTAAALSFLGTNMSTLIADALPIISLVKSGAQMLYYWGRAAQALWQESETQTNSSYLSGADDITAALKALAVMLDRKTTEVTLQASIQTADFGARGVSLFVDAGTASSGAIGAVSGLAMLVQQLYLFARELVATRRANRILSSRDSYGLQLFEAYPLLGCYMLCCSDTSELISLVRTANLKPYTPFTANNWKQVQFGEVGWMDKVEFIKREHIDPVLSKSISFINASPFYIPRMAMHVNYQVTALNKLGWVGEKLTAAYNLASVVGTFA
jgi:hypothetical protein